MNLTKSIRRLLLVTLTAGAALVPATMAGAQPHDGPDEVTDDLCDPVEEPCGHPDPCTELNPQVENDAGECEPDPCENGAVDDDTNECEEPNPVPEHEPDPDDDLEPVDPPVDAQPNFTG